MPNELTDKVLLGCCGAYCKTCPAFTTGFCKGCKIGYADKSRDIGKARCKMKTCCLTKNYISCADCPAFESCATIQSFFQKNGYKYRRYQKALMYIRVNGYPQFFAIANSWKKQYGKYEYKLK